MVDLGEIGSKLSQAKGLLDIVEDQLSGLCAWSRMSKCERTRRQDWGEWRVESHGPLWTTEKSVAFT